MFKIQLVTHGILLSSQEKSQALQSFKRKGSTNVHRNPPNCKLQKESRKKRAKDNSSVNNKSSEHTGRRKSDCLIALKDDEM